MSENAYAAGPLLQHPTPNVDTVSTWYSMSHVLSLVSHVKEEYCYDFFLVPSAPFRDTHLSSHMGRWRVRPPNVHSPTIVICAVTGNDATRKAQSHAFHYPSIRPEA